MACPGMLRYPGDISRRARNSTEHAGDERTSSDQSRADARTLSRPLARLLLLELGDGLDAAGLRHRERNLVARLHGVEQQPVLHLEFLGGAAAGADGPALSLLDRDSAAGLVDLADGAGHVLLRQRARAAEQGKRCARENDSCCLHVRLPTLPCPAIRGERGIWFRSAAKSALRTQLREPRAG